jgi:hypothetical protein
VETTVVIDPDTPQAEEPLAELERHIIDEYVRSAGYDPVDLRGRSDAKAREILTLASSFAAGKLTEVEARMHYLRSLRGQE